MKTKLLFLMLIICSFVQAQVFFQTPYASNITATTATLNVYMNLNNTYQVGYQISTDSNFTGAAIQSQLNTTAGTYNLTKPVIGLTQGTTYYIRFRAISGGNATYSPVGSFTTLSLAPSVFFAPATVAVNSATINYTINANGYNTTSVIRYGLTSTTMTSQVTGFSATGTSDTTNNTNITGLNPNTEYFYIIEATNSYGTTSSYIGTFTTTSLTPVISNITTPVTTNSATINYSLNASGSNTTSVVKYGLSSSTMTNELTGFSATGTTAISGNVLISGLTPNTQYFYKIEATNTHGTTSSTIASFTTNAVIVNQLIAEYNFNNTYNNTNGNSPFANTSGTSFITDRFGNINSALIVNNTGTTATIPNLPYGNATRTISIWAKLNAIKTDYNFLYSYGTTGSPEGAFVNPSFVIHFAPSHTASLTHSTAVWYHFVFTYDGTTSKIYRNGTLISTTNTTRNTVNNSDIFRLGLTEGGAQNYFNGTIDDLKIYNYALSDSQVASLYSSETLGINEINKNSKVNVYPNPVKDILNIKSDNKLESVDVFSLNGQKLMTTQQNKIDVSKLSSGVYIIKTTDKKGSVETQKIIKQ